jgi:uncharacterized protein
MKIIDFVKENLDPLNYNHTLRVRKLAIKIAKKEGADKKVVDVASLLHDVGKLKSEDWFKHHEKSVEMTREFLRGKYDSEFIEKVCHCIETHMGPFNLVGNCPRPDNLESKVLFDADMIDLMSPAGILKMIYFLSKQGKSFEEAVKITKRNFQDAFDSLQTESGRKIANKYYKLGMKFLGMVSD